MIGKLARRGSAFGVLLAVLVGTAAPALAQSAPAGADAEARLRKIEAEVRALQRQVFPGSDGKFFAPEVTPGTTTGVTTGVPASTPVSDLLTRMESVEAQLSRLTAQNEETSNRVAQLEAKVTALTPPPAPAPTAMAPAAEPALAAVTSAQAASAPMTTLAPTAPLPRPVAAKPVTAAPAAAKPAAPVKPTPQRVAAVQKIEKPASGNAADDEYSYGYRLWEAKFYPEAAQQLQLYVSKYPRDAKISYGRNLLGKALLDDGKAREAGAWFVQNYQADKKGARAPDSLLNLADAMRQLKDTSRACIALAEFGEVYPREAAGRLKAQYDAVRAGVKCD